SSTGGNRSRGRQRRPRVCTLASPLRLCLQPFIDILAYLVFGYAVAFLDFTFELIPIAVDLGEVVVGQLTPFFLHLAHGLFPVSFDSVPVHVAVSLRIVFLGPVTRRCTRSFQTTRMERELRAFVL